MTKELDCPSPGRALCSRAGTKPSEVPAPSPTQQHLAALSSLCSRWIGADLEGSGFSPQCHSHYRRSGLALWPPRCLNPLWTGLTCCLERGLPRWSVRIRFHSSSLPEEPPTLLPWAWPTEAAIIWGVHDGSHSNCLCQGQLLGPASPKWGLSSRPNVCGRLGEGAQAWRCCFPKAASSALACFLDH